MSVPPTTEANSASLTRDLIYAARYYLGGRRGILILGSGAAIAGAAMNWSWLVAAGIAPILLTALPCVVMCGLGLCFNRSSGASCSSGQARSAATPDQANQISGQANGVLGVTSTPACCLDAPDKVAVAEEGNSDKERRDHHA